MQVVKHAGAYLIHRYVIRAKATYFKLVKSSGAVGGLGEFDQIIIRAVFAPVFDVDIIQQHLLSIAHNGIARKADIHIICAVIEEGIGDGPGVFKHLFCLPSPGVGIDHALVQANACLVVPLTGQHGIRIGEPMQHHLCAGCAGGGINGILQLDGDDIQVWSADPAPKPVIFLKVVLIRNPAVPQLVINQLLFKVFRMFIGIGHDIAGSVGFYQAAVFHRHPCSQGVFEIQGIHVFLGVGIHVSLFTGIAASVKFKIVIIIKAAILFTHKMDGNVAVFIQ